MEQLIIFFPGTAIAILNRASMFLLWYQRVKGKDWYDAYKISIAALYKSGTLFPGSTLLYAPLKLADVKRHQAQSVKNGPYSKTFFVDVKRGDL